MHGGGVMEYELDLDKELREHMELVKHSIIKNIHDYIEKVLTECNEFCPIKTYQVIQHNDLSSIREQVDYAVSKNPELELGAPVGKIPCLESSYWIAVLVHYDFAQKELNELAKISR